MGVKRLVGLMQRAAGDGVSRAIKALIYYLSTGADDETARRLAARYSRHSGRTGFVTASKETGASDTDMPLPPGISRWRWSGETANRLEQCRRAPHRLPGFECW